ncbi:aspartate kinase [Desulforamulus reducens MI-1]|uniref:Aspartokinase n=1 Tax=Desulforamulus reducens (strain ATCC BAA-1160 / DSM 100696 / MI-1) TaxID=349161 RepID=A4J5V6_DESRM|nr:aspartate kinase [Desulforamulus reducens]ABO50459.1 aspartate kinase [Desulforamulus reducens MI-1]
MRFIIQKFGGTSLVTQELRELVANKIIAAVDEGFSPVVVVSAIGRAGEPYATDTLLNFALSINRDIPPREMDMLMSCGEIISGVAMANTLQRMGHQAVLLTGAQAGIITDDNFNDARIIRVEPQNVIKHVEQGKIVIVTGFQGICQGGDITTLGRGGSDTTASALGVALNAEYIDIYTDVEGIMTADPRIVEDARILDSVTYNEICQLAHEGAKVIHPRAVEIAMQKNIPLRVRSTFLDSPGTLVTSHHGVYGTIDITRDRLACGVTHIAGVTQLKIIAKDIAVEDPALRIFRALALADISIDFINVSPELIMLTVKDEVAKKAVDVLENLSVFPQVKPNCAKVSTVGAGMTGVPGVMASIIQALTEEGVEILQSSDSHTTIWVLVEKENMKKAIRALHRKFKLGQRE